MDPQTLALIAAFLLAFGLVSARLQGTVITPPMVFVTFGLVMGPGLGFIRLDTESEIIRVLAEATLVLVLFTDASRIDLRVLRKQYELPVRLLGIGMPLTIVLGAGVASQLFPELSFWEAAVAAAILTPTDAALGQAVVSNPRVPVRIRQALNVESGLNDGIALPVVLILIYLAEAAGQVRPVGYWALFVAGQLLLGPLAGIAVGFFGGKLVDRATRKGWMNLSFRQLSALALSFLAYLSAELIGGNGFIAAFAAGLALGNSTSFVCESLYEFGEAEGQLLALLAFMVFGGAMVMPAWTRADAGAIVYAALSLTAIRMIPVSVSLLGTGLRPPSYLFLGWFGPRGLASILFVFLVLERAGVLGKEEILTLVVTTIFVSVFAHGLSAAPGAEWYARKTQQLRWRDEGAEHVEVEEMRVRLPLSAS